MVQKIDRCLPLRSLFAGTDDSTHAYCINLDDLSLHLLEKIKGCSPLSGFLTCTDGSTEHNDVKSDFSLLHVFKQT